MSQRRIWNYGDTFTSERATVAMAALHSSGVYSGFDVTITDVDTFTLNPGFLLLPSGLLVEETSAIEMRIAPLPAAATNYTITVRHVDADIIGGQAATYALEPGLLTPSSIVMVFLLLTSVIQEEQFPFLLTLLPLLAKFFLTLLTARSLFPRLFFLPWLVIGLQ